MSDWNRLGNETAERDAGDFQCSVVWRGGPIHCEMFRGDEQLFWFNCCSMEHGIQTCDTIIKLIQDGKPKPPWQPFDTAPKDGTEIIAAGGWLRDRPHAIAFRDDEWVSIDGELSIPEDNLPDVWRPPPDLRTRKRDAMTLISLEKWNDVRRKDNPKYPKRNGLACPKCGKELFDSSAFVLLTAPPQRHVHCECGFKSHRLA